MGAWRTKVGLTLALLLSGPVFAQEENLVTNGDFAQIPPSTTPGAEAHAAVWFVPVSTGSNAIVGWSVRGTVSACIWKRGHHSVCLRDSSSISQTLGTLPGRKYVVVVSCGLDSEAIHPQDLVVVAGKTRHVYHDISKRGPGDFEFVADSANTQLELSGGSRGLGPYVYRVTVNEVNPERTAVLAAMKTFYKQLDKALTSDSSEPASSFVSSDFEATSKAGEVQDGQTWLEAVRKLPCKRAASLIRLVIPDGEGGWTATVERRLTIEGEKGPRVQQFREGFHKAGDGWLLKSSKEE